MGSEVLKIRWNDWMGRYAKRNLQLDGGADESSFNHAGAEIVTTYNKPTASK